MYYMDTVHTETLDGITYDLAIAPDDIEVRGNAQASGDNAADKQAEDAILARLDNGETWAWACVRVTASIEVEGHTFEGTDYLGCCSYRDTAEFIQSGEYYDDMKAEARHDLIRNMEAVTRKGEAARTVLERLKAEV